MFRTRQLVFRWTLAGFLFGVLFPLIGWALAGQDISSTSVTGALQHQPFLWIVHLAPLVLGAAGVLIGVQHARVDRALRETGRTVGERTAELSEANRRLEDLMQSKDQFLATVTNELRNPLAVMLGLAEELRTDLDTFGPARRSELIGLIGEQSREVGNLIEDLLVAGRTDVGSLPVVPEKTDLGHEVRTVMRSVAPEAQEGDTMDLYLARASAWADPARMRQIILTLISNAIRYGGKQIKVMVRMQDADAAICVCDDGAGIQEEDRMAIFEAYRQGQRHVLGSEGTGLYVSRTLARAMGGDLAYRYGDGSSVFEVELPATSPTSIEAGIG